MSETEWLGDVPDPTAKWGLPGDDQAAARENEKGEQPRDDSGRFVAQEPAEEAENPEPQETEAVEEDDLPDKYRGKTPAEIARMHQELEQRFGQQGQELGQLRQFAQQAQVQTNLTPQPQPQFDMAAVFEENPAQAAELAYRSGDQLALEHVLESWDAMSPGAKNLWIENKQNAQRLAQMEERFASVEQPIAAQQAQNIQVQAYQQITAQYPDFESLQSEMSQVADSISQRSGRAFVTELLQTGDPTVIAEGLEYLYLKARDLKTGNLSEVSKNLAAEHAQNVEQAKQEALVASGATGAGETPPLDPAKAVKATWDKLRAPFDAGEDGWNV